MANPPPAPAMPTLRIPRVSRLMALAILLDEMLAEGQVADQAALARLGGVTRAYVTQIMNLLHLAPDIQEQLLTMTYTSGRDPVVLRQLQPIAAKLDWQVQRRLWAKLRKPASK